jgi:3-oxoacyl-[acyl-carrier-protein] synthase II
MNRRVVITGLGIVSALGEGHDAFWGALREGKSGIATYSNPQVRSKPWCWGGEVKGFDATKHIRPKQKKLTKVMSRDIQLAMVASKFAMEDARLLTDETDRSRIGISLGASLINNDLDELSGSFEASSEGGRLNPSRFGAEGMAALTPLWMLKYLPNMPACHISIGYELQGPSNTLTTEGASGLQAIGEGFHIIRRGSADCMVVGGVDSKINAIGISKYELLDFLPKSPSGDNPEDFFHPFNDSLSGFLPGEASAILILEEREYARRRKATIYGEILGFGTAPLYDYLPQEAKDVEGRLLSMESALRQAALTSEDLDFLVAHGLGIQKADACEREAINRLISKTNPGLPVTFFKHLTGYVASASGAMETIAASLAMKNKWLPPVYRRKGHGGEINFIQEPQVLKSAKPLRALINAASLVGQAASLVIGEDNDAQ